MSEPAERSAFLASVVKYISANIFLYRVTSLNRGALSRGVWLAERVWRPLARFAAASPGGPGSPPGGSVFGRRRARRKLRRRMTACEELADGEPEQFSDSRKARPEAQSRHDGAPEGAAFSQESANEQRCCAARRSIPLDRSRGN